jgi:DNA-binding Lrp family transcriptional regulator
MNTIPASPHRRSKEELESLLRDNEDIDTTDIEILSKLQMDGRASFNTLAQNLNLSVATVSKRVRRLQDLGVIEGYSAIVSCDKLGFTENLWLMIYLAPGSDVNIVGQTIGALRGVKRVYSIFSDFDLLIHICCATKSDIDNGIKTIGEIREVTKITKMSVFRKIKEDFKVQI